MTPVEVSKKKYESAVYLKRKRRRRRKSKWLKEILIYTIYNGVFIGKEICQSIYKLPQIFWNEKSV